MQMQKKCVGLYVPLKIMNSFLCVFIYIYLVLWLKLKIWKSIFDIFSEDERICISWSSWVTTHCIWLITTQSNEKKHNSACHVKTTYILHGGSRRGLYTLSCCKTANVGGVERFSSPTQKRLLHFSFRMFWPELDRETLAMSEITPWLRPRFHTNMLLSMLKQYVRLFSMSETSVWTQ